jgi:hypothetical protein
MGAWNYRVTREEVAYPDGAEPEYLYGLREVYYDDNGVVTMWQEGLATFAGETPGEVIEALIRASGAFPTGGVLDLGTMETVRLTYHGKPARPRKVRH